MQKLDAVFNAFHADCQFGLLDRVDWGGCWKVVVAMQMTRVSWRWPGVMDVKILEKQGSSVRHFHSSFRFQDVRKRCEFVGN